LGNRIAHIINNLDFIFHVNMTDDQIRINLKKSLNMCFFHNAPRNQEGNVDGQYDNITNFFREKEEINIFLRLQEI